jgi:hypothetical protein
VRVEVSPDVVGGALAEPWRAARQRHGQRRALPRVLVVDLGHLGAVTLSQMRLHAVQLRSLRLQGTGLGKEEVDLQKDDVGALPH